MKDWEEYPFPNIIDENGKSIRTLYIYWMSEDKLNHLVGKITEKSKPFEQTDYTIEYFEDKLNYCLENYTTFDRISWCPYENGLVFEFEGIFPWFIHERTPDPRRNDLPKKLAEHGMIYYDRFEYMRRCRGVCGADPYYVHEHDNALNYKTWRHSNVNL